MEKSIWHLTVDIPDHPSLEGDIRTDALVIGGGLAGLLCARELTRAGIGCVVIEADKIMSGVSGNTTAKLTSQHGLIYHKLVSRVGKEGARTYYEANEAAMLRLRALCESCGCDYMPQSNYIYARETVRELEQEMAALQALGIPFDTDRGEGLPFSVAGMIRFPNQADFHPGKLACSVAKELKIYEHTAARKIRGTCVLTDRGSIRAEKIIVATHFPVLDRHGAYFIKMYQKRSYVLALEGAPRVEGMFRDGAEKGLSFRMWKELLLLGGGGHKTGKQGGGWAELEAFAAAHYPNARTVSRWAAQDCITLDEMPYIGQYGWNTPNLYTATGFGKWGMTSAMLSAMILTDLVQGRENPYARLFDPNRSILRPQLGINLASSAVNLLTPTAPRCTHLGCALKWNPQEHSWDCPCHGSRFSEAGEVRDNPAMRDKNL